jgi:hypothetical protein
LPSSSKEGSFKAATYGKWIPMAETNTRRPELAKKLTIALLAGLVVIAALLPWHGVDSDPPVCWSMFDYVVPCGSGLALAAGAATAGVVGCVIWLVDRRS